MSDKAAEKNALHIGEPISPKLKFFCSMVPDGVMRLRSLGPGPKLLLARLHKYAGDGNACNPALAKLADELGTSHDTITRWMSDLESGGFIKTIRHQRKEAERQILLAAELVPCLRPPWTVFENAEQRHQEADPENAEPRHQEVLITQNCVLDNAESPLLNTQNVVALKEKRIKEEDQGREEKQKQNSTAELVTIPQTGADVLSLFQTWFEGEWVPFFGSHGRSEAEAAFREVVTAENVAALFACTQSYRTGRDPESTTAIFKPCNFLRNQAKDQFQGTWKPFRRPMSKAERMRNEVYQSLEAMRKMKSS